MELEYQGGHLGWVGTVDFSTFFISALLQLEWGLPCLLLPLHFAHEARHLERNIALNTSITAGKKETEVYIQHSCAIYYQHTVDLILRR